MHKIQFPLTLLRYLTDPVTVFKGKLKRMAPFLFAHPATDYSFVLLSMVQEFIRVWKNMLFY